MMQMDLHFQISQLRFKNLLSMVESLVVFVLSLFVSALLPSLLFRYVYANQQLLEQPKVFEYIPVAAFVAGVGYFIYAAVSSILRELKARSLEKEASSLMCECCDEDDGSWLKEMGEMVEKKAAKPARKIVKSSKPKKKTSK